MHNEIIIAGFGGQGILFAGKLLALAGMHAGKQISWLPSYGPEMRGGTANCHVVISERPVASPMVCNPTILIAMNGPSWDKFKETVADGGIALYDQSLISDSVNNDNVFPVSATQTAFDMGMKTLANMIMLGALCKHSDVITFDQLCAACEYATPKSKPVLLQNNLKALKAGYDYK